MEKLVFLLSVMMLAHLIFAVAYNIVMVASKIKKLVRRRQLRGSITQAMQQQHEPNNNTGGNRSLLRRRVEENR
jgi:biopolymer transport protein ExbB/TolQ